MTLSDTGVVRRLINFSAPLYREAPATPATGRAPPIKPPVKPPEIAPPITSPAVLKAPCGVARLARLPCFSSPIPSPEVAPKRPNSLAPKKAPAFIPCDIVVAAAPTGAVHDPSSAPYFSCLPND